MHAHLMLYVTVIENLHSSHHYQVNGPYTWNVEVLLAMIKFINLNMDSILLQQCIYCILRGWIKGFNSSITTIMCQGGSYRTVVG